MPFKNASIQTLVLKQQAIENNPLLAHFQMVFIIRAINNTALLKLITKGFCC